MPRSFELRKKFTGLKDKKVRIIGVKHDNSKCGYPKEVYYDLIEPVWANYRSVSGYEHFVSMARDFSGEAVFTVNWNKDIKAGMYVLFREKAYKIVYVDDLEGYKKDLKLHCEGVTAQVKYKEIMCELNKHKKA